MLIYVKKSLLFVVNDLCIETVRLTLLPACSINPKGQ
jgi:hypothetical protein